MKFQAEEFLWLPCSHQGEKVPGLKGEDGFLLQEGKWSGMADAWERLGAGRTASAISSNQTGGSSRSLICQA